MSLVAIQKTSLLEVSCLDGGSLTSLHCCKMVKFEMKTI